MISELKDEEILEFLMTSDFEGDYKPSEFRYLLIKWRYFYRILHSKHELRKGDHESDLRKLTELIEAEKNENAKLKSIVSDKNFEIESLKSRKLTLKERFTGKII
jgi:hypothetical protein